MESTLNRYRVTITQTFEWTTELSASTEMAARSRASTMMLSSDRGRHFTERQCTKVSAEPLIIANTEQEAPSCTTR